MTNIFKTFIAFFALTALFASTSFAGASTNPVDCARQYRNCLNSCNQQEATAKRNKAQCEAAITAPKGTAAYNQALDACRKAYNAAMQQVANCRAACKRNYDSCVGGGYQGEG